MTLSLAVILLIGASPRKACRHPLQVILPPGFDASFKLTPVVFALHGYGAMPKRQVKSGKKPAPKSVRSSSFRRARTTSARAALPGPARMTRGQHRSGAKGAFKKYPLHRFAPRVLASAMSQGGWITYSARALVSGSPGVD